MTSHQRTIVHILNCNACFQQVARIILAESARKAGSTITKAKSEAAKLNGMKGGRPRSKK